MCKVRVCVCDIMISKGRVGIEPPRTGEAVRSGEGVGCQVMSGEFD